MNFDHLIAWCRNFMEFYESDEFHPDGVEKWDMSIVEAAMEAVHGPDVWNRINALQDAYDKREGARMFTPTSEQWQTLLLGGEVKTEHGTFSNLKIVKG